MCNLFGNKRKDGSKLKSIKLDCYLECFDFYFCLKLMILFILSSGTPVWLKINHYPCNQLIVDACFVATVWKASILSSILKQRKTPNLKQHISRSILRSVKHPYESSNMLATLKK